jgi:hypothetical protein
VSDKIPLRVRLTDLEKLASARGHWVGYEIDLANLSDEALNTLAAAEQRAAQAEGDCASLADLVNSWCREASVVETPGIAPREIKAAVDRLWAETSTRLAEARAEAARGRELLEKFHEWTAAFPLSEDGSRDRKVASDLYDEVYAFLSQPSSGAALLAELTNLRAAVNTPERGEPSSAEVSAFIPQPPGLLRELEVLRNPNPQLAMPNDDRSTPAPDAPSGELLPCPFCGEPPEWSREVGHTLYCDSSRCAARPRVHGATRLEARRYWNERNGTGPLPIEPSEAAIEAAFVANAYPVRKAWLRKALCAAYAADRSTPEGPAPAGET